MINLNQWQRAPFDWASGLLGTNYSNISVAVPCSPSKTWILFSWVPCSSPFLFSSKWWLWLNLDGVSASFHNQVNTPEPPRSDPRGWNRGYPRPAFIYDISSYAIVPATYHIFPDSPCDAYQSCLVWTWAYPMLSFPPNKGGSGALLELLFLFIHG